MHGGGALHRRGLAYEIIGRFEHTQTKSVRMESAIAKMLVSELLHRIIELAEEIHGLAGADAGAPGRKAQARRPGAEHL